MKETAISELELHDEAATEHGAIALVDRSIRVPVLFFFGSGVFWLVVASAFYLLSSWQMHTPSAWWALPGIAWLSFGRAYPAFLNCYIYGWATCAGIGTGIWLLSRLNGVSLRSPLFPVIACVVWNIGMITGLFSLLAGATTGRQLLEFPSCSAFILFLALAMISLWAMTIIRHRKRETASISEWYLLGAFLWFAWMYATANIALEIAPAPGVAQAAINWWYVGALVQLWLTPVALAAAYYLIPVISGRPIYSYKLALLGFWGLALFGGWTGLTYVIGGPFPAWIVTASIVAKVLLMIPVLAVAANFHLTMKGHFGMLRDHLALRFVVTGTVVYTAFSFAGSFISTRSIAQFTQFTFVTVMQNQLGLFGFYSMILFGALYYIVPRLLNRQWLFPKLVEAHFWLVVVGFVLLVFDLAIGGLIQGFGLEDPQIPMIAVNDLLGPFLAIQSFAALLLVAGNLGFVVAFLLILLISAPVRQREIAIEQSNEASEDTEAEVSVA
ncbi:MAG TPA: cbb3-type cytochrome c oxidase subunit I [Chthoniobacterales bacterium]|jgi:cytochrome c oxidase cbb3-type subunit I|nr:cbb3-type cytochrome c oxidase subunit I [Chthoniobacterales bacterium]